MSKIGGLIFEQKAPNEEDPTKLNYSWRFRESVFEDVHHCAIYWEKMQLDMEHPRAPPFDCWHRSWKYRVHRLIHQRSSKSVGIGRHTCIGRHPMGDSRNEKKQERKRLRARVRAQTTKRKRKKNKRNQQRERERERDKSRYQTQITTKDAASDSSSLGYSICEKREREREVRSQIKDTLEKKKKDTPVCRQTPDRRYTPDKILGLDLRINSTRTS